MRKIPEIIYSQMARIGNNIQDGSDAVVYSARLETLKADIERANLSSKSLVKVTREAVRWNIYELVKWLVESKGVDVNARYLYNENRLLMSASSADMVNLLLENGADIKATDRYGATALISILQMCEGAEDTNNIAGLKAAIEVLIESGCPVERVSPSDLDEYKGAYDSAYDSASDSVYERAYEGDARTPLGIAAEAGLFDIMQLLIQNGANPKTQMVAVRGSEEKTELVHARDKFAKTPEEREQFRKEIEIHINSAWMKQPDISSTVMAESKVVVEGNKDLSRIIADYVGTGVGMFKPAEIKEAKASVNVKEKIKQFENESQAKKKSGS